MSGKKHTAADGLSRRPHVEGENKGEDDIDDFIAFEMNKLRVDPLAIAKPEEAPLQDGYSDHFVEIAAYLTSLRRPPNMTLKEFNKFKKEALRYKVQDRHLFCRNSKNVPLRRVIDSQTDKDKILQQLRGEGGHRGREGTYRRVADRYWWDNLYADVKAYVKSCLECQKRDPTRAEEALHPTYVSLLFHKIGLDVVHMPPSIGFHFFVLARCDLSGWVEGRALRKANSMAVAKFMWEDIICRHGCFGKLVVDGGPENLGFAEALARRYGIKRIVTSAYHPQANGMIERGHRPIVDALSKMSEEGKNWPNHFHAALWADRSTTHGPTGMTLFRMICGSEPVLPIELDIPTWRILPWDQVHSRAELIAMRIRQLERRDEDVEEATLLLQRMRMQGKDLFDETHRVQEDWLKADDLVLLYDSQREANMSIKLAFKWLGPYRVAESIVDKGTYLLKELDGTMLAGTFAGNRLKHFHPRLPLPLMGNVLSNVDEDTPSLRQALESAAATLKDPVLEEAEINFLTAKNSPQLPTAFIKLGQTFLCHSD